MRVFVCALWTYLGVVVVALPGGPTVIRTHGGHKPTSGLDYYDYNEEDPLLQQENIPIIFPQTQHRNPVNLDLLIDVNPAGQETLNDPLLAPSIFQDLEEKRNKDEEQFAVDLVLVRLLLDAISKKPVYLPQEEQDPIISFRPSVNGVSGRYPLFDIYDDNTEKSDQTQDTFLGIPVFQDDRNHPVFGGAFPVYGKEDNNVESKDPWDAFFGRPAVSGDSNYPDFGGIFPVFDKEDNNEESKDPLDAVFGRPIVPGDSNYPVFDEDFPIFGKEDSNRDISDILNTIFELPVVPDSYDGLYPDFPALPNSDDYPDNYSNQTHEVHSVNGSKVTVNTTIHKHTDDDFSSFFHHKVIHLRPAEGEGEGGVKEGEEEYPPILGDGDHVAPEEEIPTTEELDVEKEEIPEEEKDEEPEEEEEEEVPPFPSVDNEVDETYIETDSEVSAPPKPAKISNHKWVSSKFQ